MIGMKDLYFSDYVTIILQPFHSQDTLLLHTDENEIPDSFFFQFIRSDNSFQLFFQINYITILAAPNKQKYICKNTQDIKDRFHTGFYIVLHIMIKCIITKAVWYGKSRILKKVT